MAVVGRDLQRRDREGVDDDEVAGRHGWIELVHPVDRREVEGGDEHRAVPVASPDQVHDRLGGPVLAVEVNVARRVLDLHVDEHPGAGVEDLTKGRDLRTGGPDGGEVVFGQDAQPLRGRVVVDHERTVRRPVDVELDPVGALVPGGDERGKCVLDRVARRTTMADDQRA